MGAAITARKHGLFPTQKQLELIQYSNVYYNVSNGIFSVVSAFVCGGESGKMTSFLVLLRQKNESGWSDPLSECF